jgi:hypothetical protein
MFLIPAMPAKAANLKLDIYLVWASNDEKVPNSKFKKLNEEMANKLKKIFKWKYYFEINKQNGEVPSRSTKKFNVSKKCDIEITEMEGPKVEVKLFGEGKLINRTITSLTKEELFTIAGEDKNETAWFVIIKLLEEK